MFLNKLLLPVFICLLSFQIYGQSWTNYNDTNGMFSNMAQLVISDKFNNIWVGIGNGSTGNGLDKFDGTSWTHFDNTNSGLPQNNIRGLKSDTIGNLWITYYGGGGQNQGLTKYDGSTWGKWLTFSNRLKIDFIS